MAVVVWFATLSSIVLVVILLGNTFVIVTIFRQKNVTHFKNLLILSLSLSDFCVGAFVIPSILTLPLVTIEWGTVFCKMCHHTAYSATAASVFTLCVVAFDRFWLIVFPLKARSGKSNSMIILLVLAWVLAVIYGLRSSLINEQAVKKIEKDNTTTYQTSCSVAKDKVQAHKVMAVVDCIVIFVIPFIIIMGCHIAIAWRLCKQSGMASKESQSSSKHKIVKHLLVLTTVFLICHAPLYVLRAYMALGGTKFNGYKTLIYLSALLSFVNSAVNVFLYATMSSEVKNKMLRLAFWRNVNKVTPGGETMGVTAGETRTKV